MEEYGLFIHGTASGVASIAAWETIHYMLVGPAGIIVGMIVSVGVIHQLRRLHVKHRDDMQKLGAASEAE